jgi:Fic family protein
VLGILFLTYKGLLELPVLYLSRYIIEHKHDYYVLLRDVTEEGAWEPWILYMLDAVEQMSVVTRDRIVAIRTLMGQTVERVKKELPKVYSKELVELLFRQPYTKGQFVVDAGIAERKTASAYLHELERIGVLRAQKIGKETLYLNTRLYDLLSQ